MATVFSPTDMWHTAATPRGPVNSRPPLSLYTTSCVGATRGTPAQGSPFPRSPANRTVRIRVPGEGCPSRGPRRCHASHRPRDARHVADGGRPETGSAGVAGAGVGRRLKRVSRHVIGPRVPSREGLICLALDAESPEDPPPSPPSQGVSRGSAAGEAVGALAMGALENGPIGEFCIIEGPDTLQDFARMQLEEIKDNIDSRRNRIFLLMEEIRRLRIRQKLKKLEESRSLGGALEEEEELPQYPSFIPFLPPLTRANLKEYYGMFALLVFSIIIFGGIIAPSLELRLGLGGTSYAEFIESIGLPPQLSGVDPIVASFSGGAVGVLSALLVVEVNNVKQQEHKKCMYCHGSGYLTCARCAGSGAVESREGAPAAAPTRCPNCSGSMKVMCPTCLCTGRALATEHDPRIDPFD